MANDTGNPGPSGDDAALAALRAGERAATERFVRSHAGWMLRLAQRILKDGDAAQDAVQNAFAAFFGKLSDFEGSAATKTWLHRITVNEALMLMRKDRRQSEVPIDPFLPEFDAFGCRIEEPWTTYVTPETLLQRSQTKEQVTALIAQLPDPYRMVLILRDIEDISTAEVAELLELSEANVKVRLNRARAALKKSLEPLMRGRAL